jgi:ketosteroid isomerase-like protein
MYPPVLPLGAFAEEIRPWPRPVQKTCTTCSRRPSTASLIPEPDQLATGADAVRQALSGLLAMNPTITVATHRVVRAADIALLYSSWRLRGTGVEGGAVEMEGRGTEIARRQADGRWLFVISDPFSGA